MDLRLARLKQLLLLKAILSLFLWGMPSLLAPPQVIEFFGLPAGDLTFLRIFGAVMIAIGVAYWFGSRDPLRNLAVIWMGIVDNGLAAVVIVVLGLTVGVGWFLWLSAVLVLLFFVFFLALVPKSDPYRK